ncbi:SDR family oxidoreductase [Rudaeicoccus suwonensis]|uniref:Nucleoside-diphosphate-sugar epimerase n=1 Tax=Rudaeicoccus suwonensis TaxID=657409 RepID=A0A561E4H6_9MICO|nr:SDR family oxidoreductase [Rudaeicoccus suwonensis]TWE10513.1 nucleoside-diphosphate-sugar epimerase [Rudaeicoccus suwonensis]
MQVFLTGGTGLIGTAVTAELLAHGYDVAALVRSDASAQVASKAGAEPVRGSLTDLDVIRQAAGAADGVIHLAFGNDFTSAEALSQNIAEEGAALLAVSEALEGSGKPLVSVSGTPRVNGRPSVESDPIPLDGPVGGRARVVTSVLGFADRGVRTSTVRLPRTVHRDGVGGFAGILTGIARRTGVSSYPGDGSQRWPAVHALDAATLFRLALEKAEAGTSWHAVDDEGDAVVDIAGVIGRRLGVPVESAPVEQFGALGAIFAADQPASSEHTRRVLGWEPTHPRLLADLELIEP